MATTRREAVPVRRNGGEWDPVQALRHWMSWDPFEEMLPRLWGEAGERRSFVPAFDVRESQDAFVFEADLPGFREDDIHVDVVGNRLTISGKREAERTQEEAERFYCCERSYGGFTRSFTLPPGVDGERIEAELRNGVLSLRVPKSPESQPKRIPLRSQAERGETERKAARS
jgi:HSP20 family protein